MEFYFILFFIFYFLFFFFQDHFSFDTQYNIPLILKFEYTVPCNGNGNIYSLEYIG